MKILGKKVLSEDNTIEAYACACFSCSCSAGCGCDCGWDSSQQSMTYTGNVMSHNENSSAQSRANNYSK